jgi:hypothetical protein
MKLRTSIAALLLSLASGIALASSCPLEVKKIDEALGKNTTLTAEQKAEVKKLRDEGEMLHKDGKHDASMETLGKAKKMLGI